MSWCCGICVGQLLSNQLARNVRGKVTNLWRRKVWLTQWFMSKTGRSVHGACIPWTRTHTIQNTDVQVALPIAHCHAARFTGHMGCICAKKGSVRVAYAPGLLYAANAAVCQHLPISSLSKVSQQRPAVYNAGSYGENQPTLYRVQQKYSPALHSASVLALLLVGCQTCL